MKKKIEKERWRESRGIKVRGKNELVNNQREWLVENKDAKKKWVEKS